VGETAADTAREVDALRQETERLLDALEAALVARWTWDSDRDAGEFTAALRAWGDGGLPDSEPAGRDAWTTPGGAAALHRSGDEITLVLAPRVALARAAARAD